MASAKTLTPTQRRWFDKEDEDCQETILYALNRKPMRKVLKSGKIIDMAYGYNDGIIVLNATLSDPKGKRLWKGQYAPEDWENALDGEESKSLLVDCVYECIYNDITAQDDEESLDEPSSFKLLKKLL